jgi:hypothetical protein
MIKFYYECRDCEDVFSAIETEGDSALAQKVLINSIYKVDDVRVPLVTLHVCSDTHTGIADLISGVEEKL